MRIRAALLGVMASTAFSTPAGSTTLREAFTQAYRSNPTVTRARAQVRSLDEDVPIARSQGLPSVSALGNYTENLRRSANDLTGPSRLVNASLRATLPVYLGGSVRNSIRSADARASAGRLGLRSAENQLFQDVVTVYMNVLRDQSTVELYRGFLTLLDTTLDYSRAGFRAGDLTRTDIAQSTARRELARGRLAIALAQLDASRESYLQVVGGAPDRLEAPAPLTGLPATPAAAVTYAIGHNPDFAAAVERGRAARYDVGSASALASPRLSLTAEGGYSNYFNTLGGSAAALYRQADSNGAVGVQLVVPLFQGGLPSARVRKARSDERAALEQVTEAERAVVAETRSGFYRYEGTKRVVDVTQRAIKANEQAVTGVRAEARIGSRTIVEVLNAQQELLDARLQLVTAQRDAYLAGFGLLVVLGNVDQARLMEPGTPTYDPTVNGRRVRGHFWDFGGPRDDSTPAPGTTHVPLPSALLGDSATDPSAQ